jgi:hypothetical protein
MKKDELYDDLIKYLSTPKDWNDIEDKDKAEILVLSFIGYIARPKNIPKDILKKAIEAFNNNRGKIEIEIEEVNKVIFI